MGEVTKVSEGIKAIYLEDGYKPSRGLAGWYRHLTVKEAKQLNWYGTLYATDRNGCVREVRLNGKPKVWKRSNGVVLSLKYGLRECFHVGSKNLKDTEPLQPEYHSVQILVQINGYQFKKDTPPEIVTDYVKEQLGI